MVYRAVLSREWKGFKTKERRRWRMRVPEVLPALWQAFEELEAKEFPEHNQWVFTRPIASFCI
jgi:hypothetical protein